MVKEPTQKEMVCALYQKIVGIPGNPDDTGMIGDIKEIKQELKKQNGKIGRNRLLIYIIAATLAGGGILNAVDIIRVLG